MRRFKKRMERLIRFVAEVKKGNYPNAESFRELLLKSGFSENDDNSASVKTIKRDIAFLRNEFNSPLKYDAINKGYYFTEDWVFPFWYLGDKELFATLVSGKLSGDIVPPALKNDLRKSMTVQFSAWDPDGVAANILDSIVFATSAKVALNQDICETVLEAWKKRRLLEILYKSPRRDHAETDIMEIHGIFNFENIWYLKAYVRESEAIRNFAIHRIRSAKILNERFKPRREIIEQINNDFNIFGYEEVKNVKILCDKEHAEFMAEREWFPKQTIKSLSDGKIELSYPSVPKEWLIWLILYNEGMLELKEPESLRPEIKKRALKIARIHE